MKPSTEYGKCDYDVGDGLTDPRVIITGKGILTFHLTCCVCKETVIVVKNMLELTTFAALDDKEFLGGEVNALGAPCLRA